MGGSRCSTKSLSVTLVAHKVTEYTLSDGHSEERQTSLAGHKDEGVRISLLWSPLCGTAGAGSKWQLPTCWHQKWLRKSKNQKLIQPPYRRESSINQDKNGQRVNPLNLLASFKAPASSKSQIPEIALLLHYYAVGNRIWKYE